VTRWRVTFVDAVTATRIEVDVDAPDAEGARERGWEALRATWPTGRVVVDLVDIRPVGGFEQNRWLRGRTIMKEIKAYIRREEANEVVERLRRAGAPGVSVIEIHPVGYGYEANPFAPHGTRLVDRYRHLTIVKLEIMCSDEQLEPLVRIVESSCRTGNPGDGMVFVSEVIDAVRIRDGARGESALDVSHATEDFRRAS
jgi:nitrogen regulatory protein P-II 1